MADEIMREALARIAYEDPEEPWRIAHAALKATAEPLGAASAGTLLTDAAPDLLGAAIYAVEQLAEGAEPDYDEHDCEIDPFERLRAAIAKAHGEDR